jgi:hypothetical protein
MGRGSVCGTGRGPPPLLGAPRDYLPLRPGLQSCGWPRGAPANCQGRVPVLVARGLPAKGLLAVPTPGLPVLPHLLVDPSGTSPWLGHRH